MIISATRCPVLLRSFGSALNPVVNLDNVNVSARLYMFKMAPRMAAVLRAPGKLCSFSVCFICFFVVLRVRCC